MSSPARPGLALAGSVAGAMIVALDGSVLIVAQPSLRKDLSASVAQLQWTSTAYLLSVAALLVFAGRLGDRYGHTRLLLIGSLGFGAASAGIAVAPSIGWVIILRALQGVFGALLQPATLALLRQVYPPDRLGRPVALRTSAIGVAAAAGPVLGGVLVAHFGWRSVFMINVPVALAMALLCTAVRAPQPAPEGSRRLDPGGAVLLAAALATLVNALAGVEHHGWGSSPTVLGLIVSVCLAVALVLHERRTPSPLVPPAVARSVPVAASMGMMLFTTGGMFGALFVATFFLQNIIGLNALDSGLRVLPLTVLMVLGAPLADLALRRLGARATALGGTFLVVLGIASLSRMTTSTSALVMGTDFALLGAGYATVMVTATGTVVGDAPPEYAGVVGGLKQTAMNIGPTFGIAIAAGLMPLPQTTVGTGLAPQWADRLGTALMVLTVTAALALVPASLLPRGRTARKKLQPSPAPAPASQATADRSD